MRVNPKDNRWFSAKKDGFRRKIVLLFDGVFTLRGLSRRPAEYFSPVEGWWCRLDVIVGRFAVKKRYDKSNRVVFIVSRFLT